MQDLETAETRSLPFILLLMVFAFRGEQSICVATHAKQMRHWMGKRYHLHASRHELIIASHTDNCDTPSICLK